MFRKAVVMASVLAAAVSVEAAPQTSGPVLHRVKLETTKGVIVLELNETAAPKTVVNFIQYVKEGFFDGTIFHRVISNFMIQGGGFTKDMKEKTTRPPVMNEADNGLKNTLGTIAMARTGDPHSATCQFFINAKDNDFLNFTSKNPQGWGYCVFGKVVEGIEVLKSIEGVATMTQNGHENVPVAPIFISKATMVSSATPKPAAPAPVSKDAKTAK